MNREQYVKKKLESLNDSDLSEEEPGLRDWVEGAGSPVETVGVREVTVAGTGDDGRQGLPSH